MADEKLTLVNHLNAWKQIKYPFTLADVKDLERIYKSKAPAWAFKEVTEEEG